MQRIHSDLNRLEPLKKVICAGMSLDIMFIIDCTASMGTWIEACKKEISSIIAFVRNKGLKVRTSIVAYRDFCDGPLISEVFPFSENV